MVTFESQLGTALSRAKAEQKGVLLEVFSPGCIGCAQMEEVTFKHQDVANFIIDKLVAVQLPVDDPAVAGFGVHWTPTLMVLDYYGKVRERNEGFLPPDEMVAWMLLGQARIGFDSDQYNEAVIHLNTLLNGYPESPFAPEAVFLRGVARFKASHDPQNLKAAYLALQKEYPGSLWHKKAEPYRLL